MADFTIAQGDTLPSVSATLSDANGAVNLTGATVTFSLTLGGVAVIVDRACTVTDATAGQVSVAWQAGDTANYGNAFAQFKATWADGTQSFPNSRLLDFAITPSLT